MEELLTKTITAAEGYRGTLPNIVLPTFGGWHVWADAFVHAGWRIQKNVLTGHCRLLDSAHNRRAWGSYDACKTAFDQRRQNGEIPARSPHLVVLVHGILSCARAFSSMTRELTEAGYDPVAISYPSTRRSIEDHAAGLACLLDRLDGTERISFVTHSMGGLILRRLMASEDNWQRCIALGRIVMLAPPNQGAAMARFLKDYSLYNAVYGKSGQQLDPDSAKNLPGLAGHDFGIIAGGRGDDAGFNPVLAGDNDGTVTVAETQLNGVRDFQVVESLHSAMTWNKQAIAATLQFLQSGRFAAPNVAGDVDAHAPEVIS